MLIDLDFPELLISEGLIGFIDHAHGFDRTPKRIAKGVYSSGFSFGYVLKDAGLLVTEYPFQPWGEQPPGDNETEEGRTANRAYWEEWAQRPHDYGVCDNWQQIVAKWPQIETDSRQFVITLSEIHKADQDPRGGWRWHKWGEYIGTHDPQHEHIYDEGPEIESVQVFHIYEVKQP